MVRRTSIGQHRLESLVQFGERRLDVAQKSAVGGQVLAYLPGIVVDVDEPQTLGQFGVSGQEAVREQRAAHPDQDVRLCQHRGRRRDWSDRGRPGIAGE